MAIKRLKKTWWGQWAGRHPMAWFAYVGIALGLAWSLALTVFDGTIFEIIVPITSVIGLIGLPVGFSVARDLFEEERRNQDKGV